MVIRKAKRLYATKKRRKTAYAVSWLFAFRKFIDEDDNCPPPRLVDCACCRDAVKGKLQFVNRHVITPLSKKVPPGCTTPGGVFNGLPMRGAISLPFVSWQTI
jgi:hypothetical protein